MKTIKFVTGKTNFSYFSIVTLFLAVFFFFTGPVFSQAVDIESVESFELIDRLLTMTGPGAPEIFNDLVIFTAPSEHRRVGIAFADEGFARVHWFRPLLVSRDLLEISPDEKKPVLHRDSGIKFHIQRIPEGVTEIQYRLIINGLWTTDPGNPVRRRDSTTGLSLSVLSIPFRENVPHPLNGPPGTLSFTFRGPPGETVTVAGSFNGWDPFMYELREGPAGTYYINIPLPPGRYQYVFYHRGRRLTDQFNSNRAFSRERTVASEIVLE
jgi:hypothetical protein